MRSIKDWSTTIGGCKVGLDLGPGLLSVGLAWETDPKSAYLCLPFIHLWIKGADTGRPWEWAWSLARLTVWKTEFRLELDLNDWTVGLQCIEIDDFSLHLGPFNVQVETDKGFDEDFPPGLPTLRLLFPPGHSIRPWPPRCRCCPPPDRLQCDDVTGFEGVGGIHQHQFWGRRGIKTRHGE